MYNIFLPVLQVSPVSIIQPLLHTHSSNYHALCIIFSTSTSIFPLSVSCHHCSIHIHPHTTHNVWSFYPSTSGFPCQYHSTIAPYSFIHLSPTLYNIFRQVLQVSPVSIIPPFLHTHSSTYHPLCIMYFSQEFSFPCQYHFTIAPYPFIHLAPTL